MEGCNMYYYIWARVPIGFDESRSYDVCTGLGLERPVQQSGVWGEEATYPS